MNFLLEAVVSLYMSLYIFSVSCETNEIVMQISVLFCIISLKLYISSHVSCYDGICMVV